MFYRASDPTVSTEDWMKLNTNEFQQSVIEKLREAYSDEGDLCEIFAPGPTAPDWIVEPAEGDEEQGIQFYEEPDPSDYDSAEEHQTDLAAWKAYDDAAEEALSERESHEFLPMWGFMWQTEDHDDLRAALLASGFRVYSADDIGIEGLLFGVDGAGYNFYPSHWIPLRARLAGANEYDDAETRRALFERLSEESARQGGSKAEIAELAQLLKVQR